MSRCLRLRLSTSARGAAAERDAGRFVCPPRRPTACSMRLQDLSISNVRRRVDGAAIPVGPIRTTAAHTNRRPFWASCSPKALSFPPLRRRLFFGETKKSGGRILRETTGLRRNDGFMIPPDRRFGTDIFPLFPVERRSTAPLPDRNLAVPYPEAHRCRH